VSEVRCGSCGTLNRVAPYSRSYVPRCGKPGCGAALPEAVYFAWMRRLRRLRQFGRYWWVFAVPALVLWIAWDSIAMGMECALYMTRQPAHGLYARYTDSLGLVPVSIQSEEGQNHFIKFQDPQTETTVVAFFVHGGTPLRMMMPVGQFTLKSASGQTWCGESGLFGAGTSIGEAGRAIVFRASGEHTIRITPAKEGNLPFRWIGRSKF
jgi:hypothetical protein